MATLLWSVFRRVAPLIFPAQDAKETFKIAKRKWNLTIGRLSVYSINWHLPDPQPYVHAPLARSRNIRLLRVTCSSQGPPKQFISEMIEVLVDRPQVPYLAISYTWGEPSYVATIPCGATEEISVTQSVLNIMTTLLEEGETLPLWIDAICINQQDSTEKSHQVRLMKEVYESALQVVICLGEQTAESDMAMDLVYPLQTALADVLRDNAPNVADSIRKKCEPKYSAQHWTALGHLLRRQWFSRVWVVQEAAVGANPLFVCGNRAIDWDTLAYVCLKFFGHSVEVLVRLDDKEPNGNPAPPEGLVNMGIMHEARCVYQENEPETFQEALMGLYHFNASDLRDKVFALLGLAVDTDDPALFPDYESTTEEVYQRTASHLFIRDNSCMILHKAGIGFPRALSSLPSWVPDWSSGGNTCTFGSMERTAKYRAARSSVSNIRAGRDKNHLLIEGISVDVISRIGSIRTEAPFGGTSADVLRYNAETLDWVNEAEQLLNSLVDTMGPLYVTGETRDEAFWRTLIANTSSNPQHLPVPSSYREYYNSWRTVFSFLRDPEGPQEFPSQIQLEQASQFNSTCTNATGRRRFFMTQNGYVGLTSPGTQAGDVVCIFFGGVAPFIIRENAATRDEPGTWILVGEAYVHGLMQGEGMDKAEAGHFMLI
jgi:hypothetical protein